MEKEAVYCIFFDWEKALSEHRSDKKNNMIK
jgi:hypothetical protein